MREAPTQTRRLLPTLMVLAIMTSSCTHDIYQQRTDLVKDHVAAFYTHLKENHVEAAILDNERIETLAAQMADTVRTQGQRQGTTGVEREFALMKAARDAAAQNWLALGQYFAIKKQFAQSRAAYQRVLDSYSYPTDRLSREQAQRALADLNLLAPADSALPPSH